MAALVILIWREKKTPLVTLVVLWWLSEEFLVMTCSFWRIIDWWPIPLGEDQCTAKFGYTAAAISLVALGAIAAKVWGHRE
jgi:hypothetical protein